MDSILLIKSSSKSRCRPTLLQKIIISRFARLLASLMGSGVSIVEALRIISGALGNEVYRQTSPPPPR
jgi:type II secretory pathway component PulF